MGRSGFRSSNTQSRAGNSCSCAHILLWATEERLETTAQPMHLAPDVALMRILQPHAICAHGISGCTQSNELRAASTGKPRQPRAPAANGNGGGGPRKVSNKLFMSGAFKPAPVRVRWHVRSEDTELQHRVLSEGNWQKFQKPCKVYSKLFQPAPVQLSKKVQLTEKVLHMRVVYILMHTLTVCLSHS